MGWLTVIATLLTSIGTLLTSLVGVIYVLRTHEKTSKIRECLETVVEPVTTDTNQKVTYMTEGEPKE